MHEQRIFGADLRGYLAYSLQKGLAFDIADGAADIGYNYIDILCVAERINEALYLGCDMRNYLDGFAAVFAAALLIYDILIYTSGGDI